MSWFDRLQSTVWSAVHEIEDTMNIRYPKSFSNIEDAKAYVDTICAKNKFHYYLLANYNFRPNDPHPIVHKVKDKVCYVVAARAHGKGEFYLDEPLPDRKILRDAIEADISRVNNLITWPTEFFDADVAAKYVAGVCALNKFDYTSFEGVTAEKFQGYVTFNTARQAFAAGKFELKVVRKDWVKSEMKQGQTNKQAPVQKTFAKPQTLSAAVELDVYRVNCSLPDSFWPSMFQDLNEARNFVQQHCYETRFRYTGWPDVVAYRFRLFVHFNTAKYALADGMFKVEKEVPECKPDEKMFQEIGDKDATHKDQDEIEVIDLLIPINETDKLHVEASVEDVRTAGVDATEDEDHYSSATCSTPSSETSDSTADTSKALTEPKESEIATDSVEEKKTVAIDPFENLIAELQRGYLLKPAYA